MKNKIEMRIGRRVEKAMGIGAWSRRITKEEEIEWLLEEGTMDKEWGKVQQGETRGRRERGKEGILDGGKCGRERRLRK